MLLRLADVDPVALRLDVVDPRYGRYPLPRTRPSPCHPSTFSPCHLGAFLPCQPRIPWRMGIAAVAATSRRTTGPGRRVATLPDRLGRTVYARAAVAGLPVLIVGGDRPYPHPLGLAEHDPEPCSFGSRTTRIACPCDQPPPCPHGQALYAHVVSPAARSTGHGRAAAALSRSAC